MRVSFMPMSLTGRASVRNSCSITTASLTISLILSSDGLLIRYENIKQAKSQCKPYTEKNTTICNLFKITDFVLEKLFHLLNQRVLALTANFSLFYVIMLSLNIKPIYLISAYEFIWESKTWHLPPNKKEVQSLEKQGKNNLLFQGCQQSHLFFNQKIAAKDPEKNIPSTEAKATILSPKEALKHKRKQEALLGNRGIYFWIKYCLNLDCSPNKRGFSSVLLIRR